MSAPWHGVDMGFACAVTAPLRPPPLQVPLPARRDERQVQVGGHRQEEDDADGGGEGEEGCVGPVWTRGAGVDAAVHLVLWCGPRACSAPCLQEAVLAHALRLKQANQPLYPGSGITTNYGRGLPPKAVAICRAV